MPATNQFDSDGTASPTESTAPVVEAVCNSWRVHGEQSAVHAWSDMASVLGRGPDDAIKSVVVVPRVRRVECVLDPNTKIESAVDDVAALVAAGWAVSALLPVSAMGVAHEAFRGLTIELQGWWESAPGEVRFTALETP
jgi:hypothetical protein